MERAEDRNKPENPLRNRLELGMVRIQSNPSPDAQDRLRRLFALLVRHATADRHTPQGKGPPLADGSGAER